MFIAVLSTITKICVRAQSLQSCPTLRPHGPWPARLLCPWDSPGQNTGVGCHFLLQYSIVYNTSSFYECVCFLKKIVIYFWLHCVLIAAHSLSLVVVLGLLIAVASLVAEHRLQ